MSCIKDGAFQPVAIPPPPTHFENSLRSSPLLEVGDSRKKIVDCKRLGKREEIGAVQHQ
jgi:hypothetical protein